VAPSSSPTGVERIVAFINGPMGIDNPQRQGLDSALGGDEPRPTEHRPAASHHQLRLQPELGPDAGEMD
jgi:hypothetical protein